MISKEDFIKGVSTYKKGVEFLRQLDDFGIDFYESSLNLSADTLFDMWLNQITGESGVDLVYWWLFEDVDKDIYEDDKIIANLEDIEDLYTYMKDNGYF